MLSQARRWSTNLHRYGPRGLLVLFLIFGGQAWRPARLFEDSGLVLPALNGQAWWGDYDADGRLDLRLAGIDHPGAFDVAVDNLYHNDGSSFTAAPLTIHGGGPWGDYDRDGDLDLARSNQTSCGIIRNDGGGAFADVPFICNDLPADFVFNSAAWGDGDLDGDLDLFLAGEGVEPFMSIDYTRIFEFTNEGGNFAKGPTIGRINGVLRPADFNNDGMLDLLVTGYDFVQFDSPSPQTALYQNVGGTFQMVSAALPAVFAGRDAQWADYDGDGRLDVLLAGCMDMEGSQCATRLFHNDGGGHFTQVATPFPPARAIAWGDFNNDGRPDVALASGSQVFLFANNGSTFQPVAISLAGGYVTNLQWGDYDADGRLDLVVVRCDDGFCQSSNSVLYHNNTPRANTIPLPPATLTAANDATTAYLGWDSGWDAETPAAGLSYNLRVGTTPGGIDVVAPESIVSTGYRQVPELGNSGASHIRLLRGLTPGVTYYWSVQSVDTAFAGSAFAPEHSFTFTGLPFPFHAHLPLLRN